VGSLYHPQLFALIFGALIPLPFWLWQRRYPNSWIKFISTPVVLNGVSFIPPASGINYSAWFAVGFVFQYLVRKRWFPWWSKFNYVTSAAMDSGEWRSLPSPGRLVLAPGADDSLFRNGVVDHNYILRVAGGFFISLLVLPCWAFC
jgi:hypothetical protein